MSLHFPFAELEKFEKGRVYDGLGYLKMGWLKTVLPFNCWRINLVWSAKSGFVQELCLANHLPNDQTEREVEILAKVMGEYNLAFVDWSRVFLANSEQMEHLQAYFR